VLESMQLIVPLAEKRGINIKIFQNGVEVGVDKLKENRICVRADHNRLRQVFLNLLSNAVKYNKDGGSIMISCRHIENQKIRISVIDSGEGLNEEQQSKLFVAFDRLGAELSEIEGTGIGLVITKNIVELMGGNIGINCEKGKGCEFWVELACDDMCVSNEAKKSCNKKSEENKNSEKNNVKTVLYIEDNPANLRLVTQLLGRRKNIHLLSAHEPYLGLDISVEHKPDLILLDINLPGMDGYELLSKLRRKEETKDISVVAISANAMPDDIEKGMKAGFYAYITKPINVVELLKVVDENLDRVKE